MKIWHFLPDVATKTSDFLCSSISLFYLLITFFIKTILLLTNKFYGKKKSSAFASIYLL